jgi:hypothetical protein
MWEGSAPGNWDANDPAKVATEAKVATVKQTLALSSAECHS